jgi:hypothetical protein
MRKGLLAVVAVLILGLSAYLSARMQTEGTSVRLRLVDAADGSGQPGLVRVFRRGETVPLALRGPTDRLCGLDHSDVVAGWYVLPAGGAEVALPRSALTLEAVSGLETALARQELDLTTATPAEVKVPLQFLFRPEKSGLVAGNTHLHLRGLRPEEADNYLRQIPVADRLGVLFISHLERSGDDQNYITNRYPVGDLPAFTATGVLVNNGEEHRHNFGAYGQGYGHVMFLDLDKLVEPVSLGPGLTGAGDDDRPLAEAIEEARRQGGAVIWCHNTNGHEGVIHALAGRLDAFNVFDGSRTGTFEDAYYRYLNVGLRLPISTGTDWFLYDFSRVYARVDGKPTVKGWLAAVKAGRCQATNGPLLALKVDGREPGDTLRLGEAKTVRVEATALGRHDFQRLQLIHNGRVIQSESAAREGAGCAARLVREVSVDGPGWFAARIDATTRNEFDRPLYSHTSPVYVELGGARVFDVEAARLLLLRLEEAEADIRGRGRFSSPQARDRLLALYGQAATALTARLNQRGK